MSDERFSDTASQIEIDLADIDNAAVLNRKLRDAADRELQAVREAVDD